jgi:hypothetical protein
MLLFVSSGAVWVQVRPRVVLEEGLIIRMVNLVAVKEDRSVF